MKKTNENFKYIGKYFFISNNLNYESYDCFINYIFKYKRFNRKYAVPFNVITKNISDIIIENYYIREKQDLNNRLENKLQLKGSKIKCKKI